MDLNVPGISPLLLALLSIFGGVALTTGAGFVAAWLQSRREHGAWVRERRYEAYVEFSRAEDRYFIHERRLNTLAESVSAVKASLRKLKESPDLGDPGPAESADLETLEKLSREVKADLDAAYAATVEAISPFEILGPPHLVKMAQKVLRAEGAERHGEMTALQKAMTKALRIKD